MYVRNLIRGFLWYYSIAYEGYTQIQQNLYCFYNDSVNSLFLGFIRLSILLIIRLEIKILVRRHILRALKKVLK